MVAYYKEACQYLQEAQTWRSESWPAGQPVLPVKVRRRYRRAVPANVIVTEFPVAGSKPYPAALTIVPKFAPSVLPATATVCVRGPHDAGSLRISRPTVVLAPRSTWIHWGNALFT